MKTTMLAGTVLLALAFAVTGCDFGDTTPEVTAGPPKHFDVPKPAAAAGVAATVDTSPSNVPATLAKGRPFPNRWDAFALLPAERNFDRSQLAARLVGDTGGYSVMFAEPEPEEATLPVMEPTPLWRLSGVVISDGVSALLDMGGGKTVDIHPGMKIPDTEWTVVSIDAEKAVLKRSNGKLPATFTVPLQGSLPTGGTGGGTGGGGGSPTGGDSQRGGGKLGGGG